MKTVRAKFKVDSMVGFQHGASIQMTPVYSTDPDHENKQFWDATPSGSFQMWVNNPDCISHLHPGQEVYIDITPAA